MSNTTGTFGISIFEVKNEQVNLTKICQHFGKNINEWKRLPSTKRFLEPYRNTLTTIKGNNCQKQGTFTKNQDVISNLINWCQNKTTDRFLRLELEYGKLLNTVFSNITKVAPQFLVNSYRIDFYLPEYNIAIEYDEKHHSKPKNQVNDLEREIVIKTILGCKIIRVEEGKEIESLNTICKLIINK
jgi:very-short-patch-repair endonuclease